MKNTELQTQSTVASQVKRQPCDTANADTIAAQIREAEANLIQIAPRPEDWDVPGTQYNCFNCNAMCCSVYERVAVNPVDVARLALHFNMSKRNFLRTYTHRNGGEVCLNRVPDDVLGSTCVMLNQETRLCGVHLARPEVCREWPPEETDGRCVYYDVLQFERYFQQDPDVAIRIEINTYSDGTHKGMEYEGPSYVRPRESESD